MKKSILVSVVIFGVFLSIYFKIQSQRSGNSISQTPSSIAQKENVQFLDLKKMNKFME